MSWVAVNRISVGSPTEADRIVAAFPNRSGKVDLQPGFEGFELGREEGGTEVMVLTRWARREQFVSWVERPAFREAHRRAEGGPGRRAGTLYEVAIAPGARPPAAPANDR